MASGLESVGIDESSLISGYGDDSITFSIKSNSGISNIQRSKSSYETSNISFGSNNYLSKYGSIYSYSNNNSYYGNSTYLNSYSNSSYSDYKWFRAENSKSSGSSYYSQFSKNGNAIGSDSSYLNLGKGNNVFDLSVDAGDLAIGLKNSDFITKNGNDKLSIKVTADKTNNYINEYSNSYDFSGIDNYYNVGFGTYKSDNYSNYYSNSY